MTDGPVDATPSHDGPRRHAPGGHGVSGPGEPGPSGDTPDTAGDRDATPGADLSVAEQHLAGVVRYLATQLVDDPEAVRVEVRSRDHAVHVSLRVGDGELGKVIGRQGRTARAIRTAAQIAGARHDVRTTVDIEG